MTKTGGLYKKKKTQAENEDREQRFFLLPRFCRAETGKNLNALK